MFFLYNFFIAMAHHLQQSGYTALVNRLNRFPQGAPPSPLLYRILQILMNESEANLVSLLPVKPFTAAKAASLWKTSEKKAERILNTLAARALLVDIRQNDQTHFVLPPPMAGFFEFSLMRIRKDVDQKVLSELFFQYLNEEDDFVRELFTEGETQLGRVFVQEAVLPTANGIHVLDFEKASEVIQSSPQMGISLCYCRHKMSHLNRACSAPLDICMTFNTSASSLIRHGHARKVDKVEGMDLLHRAYADKLVQFGENVREGVNFICNCCGCCCEAMLAAQRFGFLHPIHTTNYLPEIGPACTGCGKCVSICPVHALSLIPVNDLQQQERKTARLDPDVCLGCAVCIGECKHQAMTLSTRRQRVITPRNSVHKTVLMAIERDKLQNLIFDNHVLFSHRALAALLGVIFRLPPVKQILANKQLQSLYLEKLLSRLRM